MRALSRLPAVLLGLGVLAACDKSSAPSDAALLDGPRAEGGRDAAGEPRADRRDLGPDGPKKPAEWKTIKSAPALRLHGAALLKNGDVLIVAGQAFDAVADHTYDNAAAWVYRTAEDRFVSAGTMATARFWHTATTLPDGRVLVVGGETSTGSPSYYLHSAELYDPAKPEASAWTLAAKPPTPIAQHTATLLPSGKVLIAGGWTSGFDSTKNLLLYDHTSNTWEQSATPLVVGRRRHTATLLPSGKVLLAGGAQGTTSDPYKWTYVDSLEVFDPAKNISVPSAAVMSMGRAHATAELLIDGRVLLIGGRCLGPGCKSSSQWVDDLYDPVTDKITAVNHYAGLPQFHASARLHDGRVLVVGGDVGETVTAFSVSSNSWQQLPSLATGRTFHTATLLLDGSVLVVGGDKPEDLVQLVDTAERLYP